MRLNEIDPTNKDLKDLQLIQNKLVRFLNGKKISDQINTRTQLNNVNILSINQMNAQIKLLKAPPANPRT